MVNYDFAHTCIVDVTRIIRSHRLLCHKNDPSEMGTVQLAPTSTSVLPSLQSHGQLHHFAAGKESVCVGGHNSKKHE